MLGVYVCGRAHAVRKDVSKNHIMITDWPYYFTCLEDLQAHWTSVTHKGAASSSSDNLSNFTATSTLDIVWQPSSSAESSNPIVSASSISDLIALPSDSVVWLVLPLSRSLTSSLSLPMLRQSRCRPPFRHLRLQVRQAFCTRTGIDWRVPVWAADTRRVKSQLWPAQRTRHRILHLC